MAFMRMRSLSSAPPLRRRGVDGEQGDAQAVALVQAQAADELVGERLLLPAPPVPVMPTTGTRRWRARSQARDGLGRTAAARTFSGADRGRASSRQAASVPSFGRGARVRRWCGRPVHAAQHLFDHADEAQCAGRPGAEDAHALLRQQHDLVGHDDAATAERPGCRAAALASCATM